MSRWHQFDGIPDLPEHAFQHCGDKRIKPQGGGGGGSTYYANLERLYGMQADQSQQLMDLANSTVYPAFKELGNEARDAGSLAKRDEAAATAAADAASARDASRRSLEDSMASYGINPGDATFQRNLARNDITSVASDAAGRTGARQQQENLGFARLKDFTSLGMGVPSAASDAAAGAGKSISSAGQMYQAQQSANAASMGSAVRGGIDLYGLMKADGGIIERPLRLNGGGYVQRLARGGVVGTMQGIAPPAPPPAAPAQGNMNNQVAGAAAPGVIKYGQGAVNTMAGNGGSQYALASGSGGPGLHATQVATQQVNSVLPAAGETSNAAATSYSLGSGATAAEGMGGGAGLAAPAASGAGYSLAGETAAGAATAAEGMGAGAGLTAATTGATAAGSGAMAAIGTAMPYVGAAMLVGSALGLFADGGHVTPGTNGTKGGKVDGPGGPKDDLIPAMLSDGEFVMPVGAVKKFGLDRLEKMRQAGLDFEKQLGIAR